MDPFPDIQNQLDCALNGDGPMPDVDAMLSMAEAVLEAWIAAKGEEPGQGEVEGFRLLALHRQGCKGTPSFNACRETCREIVYRRNVVQAGQGDTSRAGDEQRLMAMTVMHLVLFVGGKLAESGLGDFCCSSRPLRSTAGAA